jgi:hypothetical protein
VDGVYVLEVLEVLGTVKGALVAVGACNGIHGVALAATI